jgi:hypothetical protein
MSSSDHEASAMTDELHLAMAPAPPDHRAFALVRPRGSTPGRLFLTGHALAGGLHEASPGGLGLVLSHPVPVGVRVSVALHAGAGTPLELGGIVSRASLRDDDAWRVDVRLDRPLTLKQLAALSGPPADPEVGRSTRSVPGVPRP